MLVKVSSEGCSRARKSKEEVIVMYKGLEQLPEETKKAGEKSQSRKKDLLNHTRNLQNYIASSPFNTTTGRSLVKQKGIYF